MQKIMLLTSLVLLLPTTSAGIAETLTIELPDLLGDLEPPPSGSSAAFDFGTTFLEIDQVIIELSGTFTPGSAHGDGVQFPVDEWFEVPAEIEVTMQPGVGSCFTFLNPLESPFNMQQAFELHHGASWDFLLDGTDEVTAYSNTPIMGGKVVVTPPTVEISEAYLVLEGVVPEPATLVLLAMGTILVRRSGAKTRHEGQLVGGKMKKAVVAILLAVNIPSAASATLIDSNSITKDGIEYYMETDKSLYNLGEDIEMLYRVTNLGAENVTFEFPQSREWNFWVEKDGEHIWRAVNGWWTEMTSFTLLPSESKEFPYTWNMRDDEGSLVNLGVYEAIGDYTLVRESTITAGLA